MIKLSYTTVSIFVLLSCSSLKDTTGQFDLKSKFNEDNEIFKTGYSFVYQVLYLNQKDTIDIQDAHGNAITQAILHVMPGRFFKQTKISWQYANEFGFVGNKSITGLIEDENEVWIHPPRSGKPFILAECAPFPEVHYPVEVGKTWGSKTFVPKGSYQELQLSGDIHLEWVVDSLVTNTNQQFGPEIWMISSTASSSLGTATNLIHFSPSHGFVRMKYTFPNEEVLLFELIEIRKPIQS